MGKLSIRQGQDLRAVILKILRWTFFFIILLILAGAFLEGKWLTGASGVLLCFFLTASPEVVETRTDVRYWYPLSFLVALFLVGSSIDMGTL